MVFNGRDNTRLVQKRGETTDTLSLPYTKRRILMLATLFPLIALTCYSLWSMRSLPSHYVNVSPVEVGVWDLREFDFSKSIAQIRGDVQYIPHKLLTPQEFSDQEEESLTGRTNEIDYVTSRIRILLPEGIYGFSRSSIDFAQRTYVNGQWVGDVGRPGTSEDTVLPSTHALYYTVQTQDGVVEIVQQSSNFVHKEGGDHDWILIGTPDAVSRLTARDLLVVQIIMGCFVALFIAHVTFIFLSKKAQANVYCALFCLTWFVRTGLVGPKVLTKVFPQIPWYTAIRLEYIAVPVSVMLLVLIIANRFPGVYHKWFLRLSVALSALYIAVCLIADTVVMSQSLPVYYAILISTVLYTTVRLILKVRSPRPEQVMLLIAIAMLMYAGINDILYFSTIKLFCFFRKSIMEVAVQVFVFYQMIAMLYATLCEVDAARIRKQELVAENAVLERVNQLKNQFLGNISHELRTPLTIISTHAQITKDREERSADPNEYSIKKMVLICAEVMRITEMVNQLSDIIRLEGDQMSFVFVEADIQELIESVIDSFYPVALKNDNELMLDIQSNLPLIYCDRQRIRQVILNLISNATRFTRHGTITVSARLEGASIVLSVKDTGVGIKEEALPHIFDRYYSASPNTDEEPTGTGIGLYLVKHIVEGHDGTIAVESEPGKGTTVTFTLPAML